MSIITLANMSKHALGDYLSSYIVSFNLHTLFDPTCLSGGYTHRFLFLNLHVGRDFLDQIVVVTNQSEQLITTIFAQCSS